MCDDFSKELQEIKKYVISHYPDSCFTENDKMGHYPDGADDFFTNELLKALIDHYYYEVLNWCGCGNPELAQEVVLRYLKIQNDWHKSKEDSEKLSAKYKRIFGVYSIYDNPLLLTLAYSLDAAGLTEHGSSIGSAWLTDDGEKFLYLLEHNKELSFEPEPRYYEELPCKVGGLLYAIHADELGLEAKEIEPCSVLKIHITPVGVLMDIHFIDHARVAQNISTDVIGRLLFYTTDEAQNKIKEENNDTK